MHIISAKFSCLYAHSLFYLYSHTLRFLYPLSFIYLDDGVRKFLRNVCTLDRKHASSTLTLAFVHATEQVQLDIPANRKVQTLGTCTGMFYVNTTVYIQEARQLGVLQQFYISNAGCASGCITAWYMIYDPH